MVNKTVVCIFVRIPDGRRDRGTLPPAADLYKSSSDSVQGVSEQRYERGRTGFLCRSAVYALKDGLSWLMNCSDLGKWQPETKIGINTEVVCAYLERNTRPGIFACCKTMRMV